MAVTLLGLKMDVKVEQSLKAHCRMVVTSSCTTTFPPSPGHSNGYSCCGCPSNFYDLREVDEAEPKESKEDC